MRNILSFPTPKVAKIWGSLESEGFMAATACSSRCYANCKECFPPFSVVAGLPLLWGVCKNAPCKAGFLRYFLDVCMQPPATSSDHLAQCPKLHLLAHTLLAKAFEVADQGESRLLHLFFFPSRNRQTLSKTQAVLYHTKRSNFAEGSTLKLGCLTFADALLSLV